MHVCPQDEGFSTSGNGVPTPPRTETDRIGSPFVSAPDGAQDASHAQAALVQARRALQFMAASRNCLPAIRDLADHPGWEMMLHLFIADHEGRPMTAAALSTLTGTWRPLAVRYTEMLVERGLVEQVESDDTPESWALALSDDTRARMRSLLCDFADSSGSPTEARDRA